MTRRKMFWYTIGLIGWAVAVFLALQELIGGA